MTNITKQPVARFYFSRMKQKTRSFTKSLFGMRCPRCREGKMFKTHTWSFSKPFDMYDHCPKCGLDYMPEPGFYWGAMFISYIFTGFLFLGIALVAMFVFNMSPWEAIGIVAAITIVFFIWFFRFGRSIWAHLMIRYQPNALKNQ